MSFCIFNQQRPQADGTQNTATSPMLQRCTPPYMYKFFLLISLITPFQVLGQIDNIKNAFSTKDSREVYKAVNSLNKTFSTSTPLVREIIPSIEETMIDITEIRADKRSPGGNFVYTYKLNFLSEDSIIFLYKFSIKDNKEVKKNQWLEYFKPIDLYSDNKKMQNFRLEFLKVYGDSLNLKDIFLEDIVYGDLCSYENQETLYQKKLNVILKTRNLVELSSWLKSANLEKQLFAIQGFYRLKQSGRPLSTQELNLIQIIKSKKGNVRTCTGCVYFKRPLSEIPILK